MTSARPSGRLGRAARAAALLATLFGVGSTASAAGANAAAAEGKSLGVKAAFEVEVEQPVPCELQKARKTVALMDRKGFRDQGRRFIQKYWSTCEARMSPDSRVSLANDEALLHFHDDDDAACMRALAALPEPDAGATV